MTEKPFLDARNDSETHDHIMVLQYAVSKVISHLGLQEAVETDLRGVRFVADDSPTHTPDGKIKSDFANTSEVQEAIDHFVKMLEE